MALTKIDVLGIGRGSLADNTNTVIAFSSNNPVSIWSSPTVYAQYNCVEYSSKMYRSKIAGNTANQPDLSPNQWEVLYTGVKDGDVCYVVAGINSVITQRNASAWSAVNGVPNIIALNDNQAAPANAIVFLGLTKSWVGIDYTIKRGTGQGRKRKGKMNILNDTVISDITYDHQFLDIGTDIGVTLSVTSSAGDVVIQYTSTNESVAIEMKWLITEGWA